MNIKITILVLILGLGLLSCSRNAAEIGNLQPEPSIHLKTSPVSDHAKSRLQIRFVNNSEFDSAGGKLTAIILVRKGNAKLGIKSKRITVWNQVEYFNDLLHMNTGIMGDLGLLSIPPGDYNFAEVPVSEGWVAKDGKIFPVKFPGNKMTLAFKPAFTVGEGLSPDVVMDIDVDRSFVAIKGGSAYIFKPIVKVANLTTTGSLVGIVVDGATGSPLGNAHVYVNVNGENYDTYSLNYSFTDPYGQFHSVGEYWIPGIPAGTAMAYAEKEGYRVASTEVSILEGNFNTQYFVLAPQ